MGSTPKSKNNKSKRTTDKMVGVSKKSVRRLFTYKEEDLIKALENIKNKTMGYREACRFYGVPFSTVHDRLSGKVAADKKPKVGPDPWLGVQGEQSLTKWILDMAKCGFPLSKQDLLENVSKIIAKSGIKTPFKDGKPGDTWYQKFLKRHPEISIREPEGINNARAVITETRIRSWFKELQEFIKSIDASDIFEDPERIFNGDETGFSLCPKSNKVLGPKGYKNLYIIKKNSEKENITVLLVFAASGKLCPPLVIFPYVRPPKALVESMPESWVLGRSESGWMKSDIFFEYITNDFNAWLSKNMIKRPILLFVDGHKSHMSFALSEFCQENGIILYALPANSTHMLQPADVSVFRPLKQNWKTTVKDWQSKNVNQVVTKLNFCSVLKITISQTRLEDAIKNGFRKCGLYPLNEDEVDYTKCVKDIQQRVERERRGRNSSSSQKNANVKDFDSAIKIISMIKDDLAKQNIDSAVIVEEIKKHKIKYLENRRSKSKTPRNSAASNLSTSIINSEMFLDVTPESLDFNQPQNAPLSVCHELNQDTVTFATNESLDVNISLPEPGSFISLNNISIMPLDEIEIFNPLPTIPQSASEAQCYTYTVAADIHAEENASQEESQLCNKQITFEEVFENHLHFPEPSTSTTKKRNGPKLPSAISSKAWREHYERKEAEKENIVLEKKRKQEMRAEEKVRKAEEKEKKSKEKERRTKKKKHKIKYLENRRSKSKTPRNSAASNLSTSIINSEMFLDVTPESLDFNQPQNAPLSVCHELNQDTVTFATNESLDVNISLPEPGSFISLNNISIMPLDEIEIFNPLPTIPQSASEAQCYTYTVAADIHAEENASQEESQLCNKQITFEEVFENHLHFPEPSTSTTKKRNGPKLPSAISSKAWREHYERKEAEKENIVLEKKRKQEMRAEEKVRKAEEKEKKSKEKERRTKKKKVLQTLIPNNAVLQCSQCSEDLISDVEDDLEKNIGCDECARWFHLKCTAMCKKPYVEVEQSPYTCPFCRKDETQ